MFTVKSIKLWKRKWILRNLFSIWCCYEENGFTSSLKKQLNKGNRSVYTAQLLCFMFFWQYKITRVQNSSSYSTVLWISLYINSYGTSYCIAGINNNGTQGRIQGRGGKARKEWLSHPRFVKEGRRGYAPLV